ncbi:MAG: GntR family transcriptional regulator [Chloroflexi bacterium]|nr:GntR family transcriptional regulator [Chloroflexota bacterium]MCL5074776.1 GntR family transcriptional regulator [Chloroflexota bacterium]
MAGRNLNFVLDARSPSLIYRQIMNAVRERIEANEFQVGDRLPSERELSEQLSVSKMTVRQAMRELSRAGYCYKVRGKGLFVSKRKVVVNTQSFDGFTATIRHAGLRPETRTISKALNEPPEWVREGLELNPGEKVVEVVRLRLINSEPAILETEWFPEKLCRGLLEEDLSQSLYGILESKFGIFIAQASDFLFAHVPVEFERKILAMHSSIPVIVRNRIAFLADSTPVEAVRSVYNPNQYEFRMSLIREPF